MKLSEFENKTVYLVGGTSGIGLAIAKQLSAAGAHIMLLARTQAKLQQAQDQLKKLAKNDQQKLDYRCLDVSDHSATQILMDELVSAFGVPNALINCAGRAIPEHVENISYQQFDDTMKINLYGCRNTVAALLPHMKENGGLIVNTSSLAGVIGVFGYSDYCASKFALIGYSEALRSEVKKYNIKVAVLCPPDTDTPGFEIENQTKPAETQAISQSASLLSSEQVAQAFFKGLRKNKMLIVPGIAGKFNVLMKRLLPGLVEWVMDREIIKVANKY